MAKVEVKRDWLLRARDRAVLEPQHRQEIDEFLQPQSNVHTFFVQLDQFPKNLWRALLDDARLLPNLRSALALYVFGMRQIDVKLEEIYQAEATNPVEFGTSFQILGNKNPNCEMFLNGRWYPVIVNLRFLEDEHKWTRAVELSCALLLGEHSYGMSYTVSRDLFLDEQGQAGSRTVIEVLEHFGFRRLQTPTSEFNLRLVKSERLSRDFGKVVLVTGSVIARSTFVWWRGFESLALGSPEMPARCVVEADLEVHEDDRHYYGRYGNSSQEEGKSRLPFIRIFSLETKNYVYADIDDTLEYEFDTASLDRLHLPEDMHSILSRVFRTPIERLFGDLLKGKHGGVVILACGQPGVGKTLTAEIYAETTERPLYVLELGELGTNAKDVKENLRRVFARVTRWNAVLQFDECEIFLSKRGNDLERSAIVGIFLRLLDYYRGLLFLTTNRPGVLDDAVLSRVMLRLNYPNLDASTRSLIWKTMFEVAELELVDGSFDELGKLELNGRQIRNLTRLAKILNPMRKLTSQGLREVLRFGCDLDWRSGECD